MACGIARHVESGDSFVPNKAVPISIYPLAAIFVSLSLKRKTTMKSSRARDIRNSRRTSLLPSGFVAAGDNLTEQEDKPVLHMQANSEMESKSKAQWTDEKHSLYLKSIEASFVHQLNNSDQFKVLRGGHWQRIDFERSLDPSCSRKNECQDFVANPWIQRFRSTSNHHNTASTSQQIESIDKSGSSCSLSTSSKQQHCQSFMCDEFVIGSNTEVSDQNFVDEDDGHGEIESWNRKTKRQC